MLRSDRVSAAKTKGLYTSWVSWNTLPASRKKSQPPLGMPIQNSERGYNPHLLPHVHPAPPFLSPFLPILSHSKT